MIQLYTDGASRGNPGPAGAGFVLFSEESVNPHSRLQKNILHEGCKYLGEKTNNEAEYIAIILGLELAKEKGITELSCFLDSELVVRQLEGRYKVKKPHLQELHAKALSLAKQFTQVSFGHVRREYNTEADALANKAIDTHSS